jgi:hypothetical protein
VASEPFQLPVPRVKTNTPAIRINTAVAATSAALDRAGEPFLTTAFKWRDDSDARNKLRTPANRDALENARRHLAAAHRRTDTDKARLKKHNPVQRYVTTGGRLDRTIYKDSKAVRKEAHTALKTAELNYPRTRTQAAARRHLWHAVPSALLGITDLVTPAHDSGLMWAPLASAVLIAARAGSLWLGLRLVDRPHLDPDALTPTAAEAKLLNALDPEQWPQLAEYRGIGDVQVSSRRLTESGIHVELTFVGAMTVTKLRQAADQLRAALALPEGVRYEIREGKAGGTARLTLRTRVADTGDNLWNPQREGIGVDVLTGQTVDVPVTGVHSMTGGRTNMGKSAYARIQLMRAYHDPLLAGVVIDPKRAEAHTWHGKIRTAGQAADIDERDVEVYALLVELMAEFRHRQTLLDGLEWVARPDYPELFVTIDEGAALFRMSQKEAVGEDGKKYKPYEDALEIAETLYGEARVVGLWFNWASQYLAKGTSIPQLVKENAGAVIGLTTKGQEGDRMLFGETAGAKGWTPSTVCAGVPGRALVEYRALPPHPVQLWHVTGDMIAALPDVEPWRSKASGYASQPLAVGGTQAAAVAGPVQLSGIDREALILRTVREHGPVSRSFIARETCLPKGTVSDYVNRLLGLGVLAKTDEGIVLGGA